MSRVQYVGASAISPTVYASMVQVPLYKSLVSMEVANTQFGNVVGNAVKIPRYTDLSAQTYTPGTPFSATNVTWAFDTLNISTCKVCPIYIDTARSTVVAVDQASALAPNAAYQLRNAIDKFVFGKIKGAGGFTYVGIDASGMQGGTAHRELSATSANILNIFTKAKQKMREANVEEIGDWCAVVTPTIAQLLEIKLMNVGFNVADSTLRNGFSGANVDGFDVYISNNLPSGVCSTLNPSMSVAATSATTGRSLYFGRKKMIDLALLRDVQGDMVKCDDKLGYYLRAWTYYGATVTTNNAKRGLNVVGNTATFG